MVANAGCCLLLAGLAYHGNELIQFVCHLQKPSLAVSLLQGLFAHLHTVNIQYEGGILKYVPTVAKN